jgi:hypothetical protein
MSRGSSSERSSVRVIAGPSGCASAASLTWSVAARRSSEREVVTCSARSASLLAGSGAALNVPRSVAALLTDTGACNTPPDTTAPVAATATEENRTVLRRTRLGVSLATVRVWA